MKVIAALLFATSLAAAQDSGETKERILGKVREKIQADHATLLKRIEKIIDEELSQEGAAVPSDVQRKLKEVERKLRALDDQRESLTDEVARLKREAADEPVKQEAKKNGPHEVTEAREMFDEAIRLHEKEKKFEESILLFKKIYYQFSDAPIGTTSAYNIACGYALKGRKDEALDWLELSVKHGFANIDHLRTDPDLESLRGEKRYKKLLTDK